VIINRTEAKFLTFNYANTMKKQKERLQVFITYLHSQYENKFNESDITAQDLLLEYSGEYYLITDRELHENHLHEQWINGTWYYVFLIQL
jgi:hypothetical protein